MVISFYGESCFKIQSGETTLLIDPIDPKSGLTAPRFKYDAVIKTLSPFPPENEGEEAVIVSGPGEYDFKGVKVSGYPLENESAGNFLKTAYIVTMESIRICLMGHVSEIPQPEVMEHIEEIDIMIIPAGGSPFIDHKNALKIIRQTQPKIIIPTFHKVAGLKRKTEDLKVFLEEIGKEKEKIEPQEKLTIKKKDFSGIKPGQVVVLKI